MSGGGRLALVNSPTGGGLSRPGVVLIRQVQDQQQVALGDAGAGGHCEEDGPHPYGVKGNKFSYRPTAPNGETNLVGADLQVGPGRS